MTEEKRLNREIERLNKTNGILAMTLHVMNLEIERHIKTKYKDNYRSAVHKQNKSYPFIPYKPSLAVDQLIASFEYLKGAWNKTTFLDAGCGIGNIMLLAQRTGFKPFGLEIDPTVISMAKKINIVMSRTIKKQNIMTYKEYDKFDVIYYFRPIDHPEKEKEFEEYVENQMKIGAVLIPNYKASDRIEKDSRFDTIETGESGNLSRVIYVKTSE